MAAPTLLAGHGYVEVSWASVASAGMYQVKRRVSGGGSYTVIETLPGLFYIDISVANGTTYDYVIAPKINNGGGVFLIGADSASASVTPFSTLPSELGIASVNTAISGASAGATIDVPDGIYRVTNATQLILNKAITLRSNSRKAWFLASENYQNVAVNASWTAVSSYWRSAHTAPTLSPNNTAASYTDATLEAQYQVVVGITTAGVYTRFTPLAPASTPGAGRWCYESSGDHRIRIGTNPTTFARIEISAGTHWATTTAANVKLIGLTFRYASSGASEDPVGNNDNTGYEMRNCVVSDTHGVGLNLGASNVATVSNFVVDRNLFDHCGNVGISMWQMNTGVITNNRFVQNGLTPYDWRWQGGDDKLAGTWNYTWAYNVSVDGTRGTGIWADGIDPAVSNRNALIYGNKVGNILEAPALNWEISEGPATIHDNCLYDGVDTVSADDPTIQINTSGRATVYNNLIRAGAGGSASGRLFQLQHTARGDAPAVIGSHNIHDNLLIRPATTGASIQCIWSDDTVQSDGNIWAANKWHVSGTGTWLWGSAGTATTVAGWNALTGGSDVSAVDAVRDAQLKFWGLIFDDTSGGVAPTPGTYAATIIARATTTAYYRLGGNALDSHGTLHGTNNGATFGAGGLPGDSDQAAVFAGAGEYVSVPTGAYGGGDTFAIEFFAKRTATQGTFQILVSKGSASLVFGFADTNTIFVASWAGVTLANSTIAITDLNWHLYVIQKDGTAGGTQIWIDGVNRTASVTSASLTASGASIYIGRDNPDGYYVTASIDEVAFFSAPLTPTEIATDFANASPGPVISGISASVTSTSMTVTWTTDQLASSQVEYGPTVAYGTSTAVTDVTTRVTSHSVTVNSLSAGTLYHYRVISVNAAGGSTTSGDNTATTAAVAGPVISNVVSNPTSTQVTITWTTSAIASSRVDYGLTSSYSNVTPTTDTSPRVLSHSVTITGLTASTTYHYAVTSVGGSANSTTSGDFTFATLSAAGPVISNIQTTRTQTTAMITWTTNVIASSQVNYGVTVAYGTTTTLADTSPRVTSHSVLISGLVQATQYHYRVRSIDGSANETVSGDNVFTTLSNVNPAGAQRPTLLVDVDFSSNATAVPLWTDVTSFVRGFSSNRGRQFELDRIQAGTLTLLIDNQDRRFDPSNASSPYSPFVLPMRRVRVRATWNSVVYPVFQGFVESWPQQWQGNGKVAEVPVMANDGFQIFSMAKVNDYHPTEKSGDRITSILNSINWGEGQAWILGDATNGVLGTTTFLSPIGGKNIDQGSTDVQASTLENTPALDHIQLVTDTENGVFFIDRAGIARFISRAGRISAPYNTSQGTFGDGGGTELPYHDLTLETSPIWNEVIFQREGGAEQVQQDSVSRTQYYSRTKQVTGLLHTTDGEVATAAQWVLSRYKDPGTRITGMQLYGQRNPSVLWPQLLGREIGDRITIVRRPPGGGAAILQENFIEGISHDADAHGWTTLFKTSPADLSSYWILGDAVSSILGTSTRLSY